MKEQILYAYDKFTSSTARNSKRNKYQEYFLWVKVAGA
jgi:hypothetical protein